MRCRRLLGPCWNPLEHWLQKREASKYNFCLGSWWVSRTKKCSGPTLTWVLTHLFSKECHIHLPENKETFQKHYESGLERGFLVSTYGLCRSDFTDQPSGISLPNLTNSVVPLSSQNESYVFWKKSNHPRHWKNKQMNLSSPHGLSFFSNLDQASLHDERLEMEASRPLKA